MATSLEDKLISIAIVIFVLSQITERINNFLKLYLPSKWFGNLKVKVNNESLEKDREKKILLLSVICGVLVAIGTFYPLSYQELPESLKWVDRYTHTFLFYLLVGIFLSFGSKFWHDLLDILLEIKNYKKVLANPDTYRVDNVKSLEKILTTYQSDFIKAAFLQAKSEFMSKPNVKAISLKMDSEGYYFELTLEKADMSFIHYYQYLLEDGTPHNIRIKLNLFDSADEIKAHSIDLKNKIFDKNSPSHFGTLGCLVKSIDKPETKYILTCCHNVVYPISKLPLPEPPITAVETEDNGKVFLGNVKKAVRDHEIDAALVELTSQSPLILNQAPKMGQPQKPRTLKNNDIGTKVFLYGAASGEKEGTVASLYCDIKIKYEGADEFQIINTIAISYNGKAITKGGDSGTCVLDANNNVIGLVVAGSSKESYVIPINTLLSKLNVQLV